jgi:hypothetical protein
MSSSADETQTDPVLTSSRDALRSLGELSKLRPEDKNVVTWTSTLTGLNARLEQLHAAAMTLNGDKGRSQVAVSDFASSAHSLYLDVDALGHTMLEALKERVGVDTLGEFNAKTKTDDESKLNEIVERLWPVRQKLEGLSKKWRKNKGSSKSSRPEKETQSSKKTEGEGVDAPSTVTSAEKTSRPGQSAESGGAPCLSRKKLAQPETVASDTATSNSAKNSTVPVIRKATDMTLASDPASSAASSTDTALTAAPSPVARNLMRSSARPTESTDTSSSTATTAVSTETKGANDSEAAKKLAALPPQRAAITATTASTASSTDTAPSADKSVNAERMMRSAPRPAEPTASVAPSAAAPASDKIKVDAVVATPKKSAVARSAKPVPSSADSASRPEDPTVANTAGSAVKKADGDTMTPSREAALRRKLLDGAAGKDEGGTAEKKAAGAESTVPVSES